MEPKSPVIPEEVLKEVIVAEHQDQYRNLPVTYCNDEDGGRVALSRWELTEEDKEKLLKTGNIFVYIWTRGNLFNPMLLSVEDPEMVETKSVSDEEE
jgi:hypothetical protein